jgi:CDP-diglyceride synthetase
MNRLKNKAWQDLIVGFVLIVLVTIPYLFNLYQQKANNLSNLIVYIVIVGPIMLIGYLNEMKNLKQFDEWERFIYQKSCSLSDSIFFLYLLTFSFISFFLVDNQKISVVSMPVMVLSGWFLAQCVLSIVILLQCKKEDDEITEGGAA